jgi:hypothetical protein
MTRTCSFGSRSRATAWRGWIDARRSRRWGGDRAESGDSACEQDASRTGRDSASKSWRRATPANGCTRQDRHDGSRAFDFGADGPATAPCVGTRYSRRRVHGRALADVAGVAALNHSCRCCALRLDRRMARRFLISPSGELTYAKRASLAEMMFGKTSITGKEAHGCGILPKDGFSGR